MGILVDPPHHRLFHPARHHPQGKRTALGQDRRADSSRQSLCGDERSSGGSSAEDVGTEEEGRAGEAGEEVWGEEGGAIPV